MTIWTIVERSREYNGHDYDIQFGGQPVEGYKSEANARAACDSMNKSIRESGNFPTESKWDYFYVVPISIYDEDVFVCEQEEVVVGATTSDEKGG